MSQISIVYSSPREGEISELTLLGTVRFTVEFHGAGYSHENILEKDFKFVEVLARSKLRRLLGGDTLRLSFLKPYTSGKTSVLYVPEILTSHRISHPNDSFIPVGIATCESLAFGTPTHKSKSPKRVPSDLSDCVFDDEHLGVPDIVSDESVFMTGEDIIRAEHECDEARRSTCGPRGEHSFSKFLARENGY